MAMAGKTVIKFLEEAMDSAKHSWAKFLRIDAGKSVLNLIDKAPKRAIYYKRAGKDIIDLTGSRQSPFMKFIKGIFGFTGGDEAIAAINSTAAIAENIGGFSAAAKQADEIVSGLTNLKGYSRFKGHVDKIVEHFNAGNFDEMNKSIKGLIKAVGDQEGYGELTAAVSNLGMVSSGMNKSLSALKGIGFEIDNYGGFFKWAKNLSDTELSTLQSFKGLNTVASLGISAMGGLSRGGFVGGTIRAFAPFLVTDFGLKMLKAPAQLVDIAAADLRRRGSI